MMCHDVVWNPGSPGLVRLLLEHLQSTPGSMGDQEGVFLQIFTDKVCIFPVKHFHLGFCDLQVFMTTLGCVMTFTFDDAFADIFKHAHPVQVLGARGPVPAVMIQCYKPLLVSLSAEAYATTLLPALLKVVKRLPEIMLPVTETVLSLLSQDLSPHAEALMKDLAQQLRQQKEAVRCAHLFSIFS